MTFTININFVFSQTIKKFTSDSLISELRFFYELNEANLEKNLDAFKKDSVISVLGKIWSSSIENSSKEVITKILNFQIKKRYKKETTIWDFITTINYLKNNNSQNFNQWLKMLEYMTGSPLISSSSIKNFITNIKVLVYENYLSKTKKAKWKIEENTAYKFKFNNEKKSFIINVPNTLLSSQSQDNDEIKIINTAGEFDIIKNQWKGKKGTVTWEKFDYSPDEMNAKLNNYVINMHIPEFSADSVTYTNKAILESDVLGKLSHRASMRAYKNGLFPQFRSYKSDFKIKSKQDNVFFTSGIEMKGYSLSYVGSEVEPATAEYIKNGKKYLKAKSENFISLKESLQATEAGITLYIANGDSITHPNVFLFVKENDFSFTRNKSGTGKRPFYNSYQKVYMTVDNINWNIQDSLIRFYSKSGNIAQFKSFDYFTKNDFTKHRMYETRNPLFDIRNYTRDYETRDFYASDYANYIKINPTATKHRLMGLWYEGFLDYNPKTEKVFVREKLYNYIKYFFDKKDYDVINIKSKGKARKKDAELFPIVNATFDVKTNQMAVYGVDRVVLNKRKKVGFEPYKNEILLDFNRNMFFSGRLRVGLADFYSKNGFAFNYENYNIKFTNADSLTYRVWDEKLTKDSKGMKPKFLTSNIEQLTGEIKIDIKENKSGAKNNPIYPTFDCTDTSYVYYNQRNKQGNEVFKKDRFYFTNYPFSHDSLLYLTKDNLKIYGKLIAGGIFPNFEDTLEVQKDYSLGLIYETPDEGLKLFSGKGTLSSQNSNLKSFITLSNQGLQANGKAKWNNMTVATKKFNLYPDSLTALADKVEITEFVNTENYAEFPQLEGENIKTSWDAVKNVVKYTTTRKPAEMYNGKVQFTGEFEYRPKSLTGSGVATVDEGTLTAEKYSFNKKSFFSEKADISLKGKNEKDPGVIIKNMRSYVDTKSDKAVFAKIKGEDSHVNFVTNQYKSYPSHLVWHTGKRKINLNYNMEKFTNSKFSKEDVLLSRTELLDVYGFSDSIFSSVYGNLKFISTNKDNDSLTFLGSRSNYSLDSKRIITKDVQKIIVADIVVTPSSDVIIDKNGEMEKLLKTTVRAKEVHNITEVDILIKSSNKYTASSGIYQYEDMNKVLQNINFDNITYDQAKEASVAHGFIEQYEKFTLNPWFEYYGDVFFNASKDRLNFDGHAKIIHKCTSPPQWFYFKSEINPDSIYLPLDKHLHSDIALNKARIFGDIMSSQDSIHTFPVFLSNDPYGNSESLFSVRDSGNYVTYNQIDNRYEITSLNKFNNKSLPDNYFELSRNRCLFNAEGKLSLSNSIKIDDFGSIGEISFDSNSDKINMNTLTYLDFLFSKKSLSIMSDKIIQNLNLPSVDLQKDSYKKPMSGLIGKEETDEMLTEMSINEGKPKKFPKKLNKTIVFTNLFFKWDADSKSYKSMGKIGISNIGDKMINKYVDGYIQIRKRKTGDKVYIYLEPEKGTWFFFTFSGGIMRTISSIHDYNQTIADLKTKHKKKKTKNGTFNYMLTNNETKNLYIYEFTGVHPAIDDFNNNSQNNSSDGEIEIDEDEDGKIEIKSKKKRRLRKKQKEDEGTDYE